VAFLYDAAAVAVVAAVVIAVVVVTDLVEEMHLVENSLF
jgi:hypothetical protein